MTLGDLDESVLRLIAEHRTGWATAIAEATMALGTTVRGVLLVTVVGLTAVVWLRAYRAAALAVAAAVVTVPLTLALKDLIGRPRPPATLALVYTGGGSFPSTQAALTAAGVTAFLLAMTWANRGLRSAAYVACSGLVVLVGGCMVYLGAHWFTDVVSGWLLGILVGVLAGLAVRRPWRAPVHDDRLEALTSTRLRRTTR